MLIFAEKHKERKQDIDTGAEAKEEFTIKNQMVLPVKSLPTYFKALLI